jgi:hypothetical protein
MISANELGAVAAGAGGVTACETSAFTKVQPPKATAAKSAPLMAALVRNPFLFIANA